MRFTQAFKHKIAEDSQYVEGTLGAVKQAILDDISVGVNPVTKNFLIFSEGPDGTSMYSVFGLLPDDTSFMIKLKIMEGNGKILSGNVSYQNQGRLEKYLTSEDLTPEGVAKKLSTLIKTKPADIDHFVVLIQEEMRAAFGGNFTARPLHPNKQEYAFESKNYLMTVNFDRWLLRIEGRIRLLNQQEILPKIVDGESDKEFLSNLHAKAREFRSDLHLQDISGTLLGEIRYEIASALELSSAKELDAYFSNGIVKIVGTYDKQHALKVRIELQWKDRTLIAKNIQIWLGDFEEDIRQEVVGLPNITQKVHQLCSKLRRKVDYKSSPVGTHEPLADSNQQSMLALVNKVKQKGQVSKDDLKRFFSTFKQETQNANS